MPHAQLEPSPPRLVAHDGLAPFGNYAGPILDLNAEAFDFTALERWPWSAWGVSARRLFKRWQFVGVIDGPLVLGAAVAHVQYLATGFAYVYERESRQLTEVSLKAPLAVQTAFSRSPAAGETRIRRGRRVIRSENTPRGDRRTLEVDLGDAIQAEVRFRDPDLGVSTLCPQDGRGFHYTYKAAGLPAEGVVTVQGREYRLTDRALALFDWTASTPPRQTTWNWSCAVGADGRGRTVGINFSRGLVGGAYSQNCVWVEGRPHLLGYVDFRYDPDDILGTPWQLVSEDGRLELTFQPEQERYENIDLKLVASALHQPFGAFRGRFDTGEETLELEAFGFCEQHYAKW